MQVSTFSTNVELLSTLLRLPTFSTVTFIDDFSRCTWLFLLKDRSELFGAFQMFYSEIKNQFGKIIRVLRGGNAKEYFFAPFKSILTSHDIIHKSGCPHTPQQNSVIERKNRHIVDTTWTRLINAKAPSKF